MYGTMAHSADSLCESNWFVNFVTVNILIVSVTIGIETDEGSTPLTSILNDMALGVFAFEAVVKIISYNDQPLKYFHDAWNRFDIIVVIMGFVEKVRLGPNTFSMSYILPYS